MAQRENVRVQDQGLPDRGASLLISMQSLIKKAQYFLKFQNIQKNVNTVH